MNTETTQNASRLDPSSQPETSGATLWEIDAAHSSASFSVRHMMIAKVRGGFTRLSGSLRLDRRDPAKSSVEAFIEAASIDTHEPKRDEHLRSADFFDVQKYPQITFKSTRVKAGGGRATVTGELTLHGITREIELEVEGLDSELKDPWGNVKAGASATTQIKRKEFGLTWNAALESGGVLVGDDITINLDIQFLKKG